MGAAQGMLAKLGIDTVIPVTKAFDFLSCTLDDKEELKDNNGLRGTLAHDISRMRQGKIPLAGQLVMHPNPVELALLMPWMYGGTPSGSPTVTYPLADTVPTPRYVVIDRVAKVDTASGVQIDKISIKGDQGEPLKFTLDLVGTSMSTGNAGTFPSLTLDTSGAPFMFQDLVLQFGGVTYQAKEFELTIDYLIDKDRFFNSQRLVSVVPTDRKIMFKSSLPFGDAAALYGAGGSGVRIVATFTNGSAVLVYDLIKVAFPSDSPPVEGRKEIMLPIEGQAYKSSGTLELVTTLNPG